MKNKMFISLFIFILSISLITSCNGKDEKNIDEEGAAELPTSFKQFQELSDEIITTTMNKDWANSLNNVKEFQTIWTGLYPELKKQGVSTEDVDSFVHGLNELSDLLISKTLNLPQQPPPKPPEEGISQQKENQSESQSKENGSNKKDSKNATQAQEDKNSESGSSNEKKEKSSDDQSSDNQDTLKKEDDPHKILKEIDPILSAEKEELIIINSAVEVSQHLPRFMILFKSPVHPDMYKLKYLVRHLDVNSKLDKWDAVFTDLTEVTSTWTSLQSSAITVDQNLKIKIDQCIEELKTVIDSKNSNLTGLKSTSFIVQIEDLIKKIEDKEKENEKE